MIKDCVVFLISLIKECVVEKSKSLLLWLILFKMKVRLGNPHKVGLRNLCKVCLENLGNDECWVLKKRFSGIRISFEKKRSKYLK